MATSIVGSWGRVLGHLLLLIARWPRTAGTKRRLPVSAMIYYVSPTRRRHPSLGVIVSRRLALAFRKSLLLVLLTWVHSPRRRNVVVGLLRMMTSDDL